MASMIGLHDVLREGLALQPSAASPAAAGSQAALPPSNEAAAAPG